MCNHGPAFKLNVRNNDGESFIMMKNGNETFQSTWPKHHFTNEVKQFCARMIDLYSLYSLGCKQKASNFHSKVFSFLLIVHFEISLLLFYICLLLFSLWIKTNVTRTAFWAVRHMHIFLGSCISPMGSEQNGPKTLLFQQRPRHDREQHWLEDRRLLAGSDHRLPAGVTALCELLHLSPISLPIRLTESVQQPCYYCQFCSLPHNFWTTERLKY